MDEKSGCWNCLNYHPGKGACTINWNNLDESLYNPVTDNRQPGEYCKEHAADPFAVWEFFFSGVDAN